MNFDARYIARGWLAVALASAAEKDLPSLNRTIHIEEHAAGVRLIATDGYVLLHSWVPDIEHDLADEPGLDEIPMVTATARDPHSRAKGFFAHALKLAVKADEDGDDPIDVRLRLNVGGARDDRARAPGLPGLEALAVVCEMPDVERVVLEVYDGTWPAWRRALGNIRPVKTTSIALDPDIVGRLAKVAAIHPWALLGWTFGGPDKAARLEVLRSEPHVEGLVMPCRWDFDRNAPRPETASTPTAKEDADGI